MANGAFDSVGHWLFKAFPVRSRVIRWMPPGPKGCSSIGRALVSKTSGCGFKSLRPCFELEEADRSADRLPTRLNGLLLVKTRNICVIVKSITTDW